MDELHVGDSDTKRDPKTYIMKYRVIILEKTIEKMKNTMFQHGEKVDQMVTAIGRMKHGFNRVILEFQAISKVIIDTLTDKIHDRLKETQDTLVEITYKLKDQDATITLLKRALANGQKSIVILMRIKIKEPEPYDKTHNTKLLGNFNWVIEQYLEQLNRISDEAKVNAAVMFLTRTAKLWWRN